jgi:Ni/Fe-hydrogenase subunit HybB-like protein
MSAHAALDRPRGLALRLRPLLQPWTVVAAVLMLVGAFATFQRFYYGLGRTTNLSDTFPWGLWIGLDFLGIGLAASGFTIVAAVHLLNVHRFEPIVRPAILTAFIGYMLVVAVLVVDLGRPDRFWHPLVMWNPHSVMFEITWCLILYSTVLVFELAPVVLERFMPDGRPRRTIVKSIHLVSLPLMLAGVILSTLHQSSFGSLYLVVPGRLHPLWYSPILPVLFYVSCLAAGLSTVIFLSLQVTRSGRRRIPMALMPQLAKIVVVILAIYGTIRIQDLLERDALQYAFRGGYHALLFAGEFLLGVVAPILLLLLPRIRATRGGLFAASILVLAGFAANRMNTVVTGLEGWPNRTYFPSWQEVAIGLGIAALGFTGFALLSKLLAVLPEKDASEPEPDDGKDGIPLSMMSPSRREMILVALIPTGLLMMGIGMTQFFTSHRGGPAAAGVVAAPDLRAGKAAWSDPPEIVFNGSTSPGPVTFRHASHVDGAAPGCAGCHGSGGFLIVPRAPSVPGVRTLPGAHDKSRCGACHDVEASEKCADCHAP